MTSKNSQWIWLPRAGHFSKPWQLCFFLTTIVQDYTVSTIGEWLPDKKGRDEMARIKGRLYPSAYEEKNVMDYIKEIGFMPIYMDRFYETRVFFGKRRNWMFVSTNAEKVVSYYTYKDAIQGHYAACHDIDGSPNEKIPFLTDEEQEW